MIRIGITGHQNLSRDISAYVAKRIAHVLAGYEDVVGISSLAAGADQIFAEAVLSMGGRLDVVVPSRNYESSFANPDDRLSYNVFLSQAWHVILLPFIEADEDAYLAAGQEIVRRIDLLLAVWDGQPARGKGGTGDIVEFARAREVPVTIVWPLGQVRN